MRPLALEVQRARGALAKAELSTIEVLDLAYGGRPCELVRVDGSSKPLPFRRWTGNATTADLRLFVEQCSGPTLDVGCGPGRLAAALAREGVAALGIDISPEAVRQARLRGATAACLDVFGDLPSGDWQHIVLADGNVGLGGDPCRLLGRVVDLLAPNGSALIELAEGSSCVHRGMRLRVGTRLSPAFAWATVGTNDVHDLAQAAGLTVHRILRHSGRVVAILTLAGAVSAA